MCGPYRYNQSLLYNNINVKSKITNGYKIAVNGSSDIKPSILVTVSFSLDTPTKCTKGLCHIIYRSNQLQFKVINTVTVSPLLP